MAIGATFAYRKRSPRNGPISCSSSSRWHPTTSGTTAEFGVQASAALGRKSEAIRYAEAEQGVYDNPRAMAQTRDAILLSSGLVDEACRRYGLLANHPGTYVAWYRVVARKSPQIPPDQILDDLVASTPGEEGKWFAAAKQTGLFDEAIALVQRSPCAPQTQAHAARDFAKQNPPFAFEAGMAAERLGSAETTRQRIRGLVATETGGERFVTRVLSHHLGLA